MTKESSIDGLSTKRGQDCIPENALNEIEQSHLFDAAWYANEYKLTGSPTELLLDYLGQSPNHERWPNKWFDPKQYANKTPELTTNRLDPLLHYIRHGWREKRPTLMQQPAADIFSQAQRKSLLAPLFWPEWYRRQIPQGACSNNELLDHFLRVGVMSGANPNPLFNSAFYEQQYPELDREKIFPVIHYLLHGFSEGRDPHWIVDSFWIQWKYRLPEGREPLGWFLTHFLRGEPVLPSAGSDCPIPALNNRNANQRCLEAWASQKQLKCLPQLARAQGFEPLHTIDDLESETVKLQDEPPTQGSDVIAFYLPQFHAIPENDKWWGSGFTEWHNLAQAQPLYPGHIQPRWPHSDLGCYKLEDINTFKAQIKLAREHGVTGFCFYHYWFNGKRLLEKPVNLWINSSEISFPFCLCWANETWSRRWDGRDHEVLIAQEYQADYVERFGESLLDAIKDEHYIRWNNKPVILIYRVSDLPDPSDFSIRLRRFMRQRADCDPYLLTVWSFDRISPLAIGFDGAVQFPPLQIATPNLCTDYGLEDAKIYGYPEAISHGCFELARPRNFPLYPGVCPSWDNTPRKQAKSVSWLGASPERFSRWVKLARHISEHKPLFVNAWNEWGEGCHLEPDTVWGYGWLEALRTGLSLDCGNPANKVLLLIGHDAFNAGSQRCLLTLIAEIKECRPSISIKLILGKGGELLASYKALCEVHVLGQKSVDDDDTVTRDILGERHISAVLVNTIASLDIALKVKRNICGPSQKWGIYIHEYPESYPGLLYRDQMVEAARHFDFLVAPSPMLRAAWDFLNPTSGWITIPPRDDQTWLKDCAFIEPDSRWIKSSSARLLGFGRDEGSFDRFRIAIKSVQHFLPDVLGLWVGPVGQTEDGIIHQQTVNVSEAINHATLLLATKPGETFGLIMAEALEKGCPVLGVGNAPLGISAWWPNSLRDELENIDYDQLSLRITKIMLNPDAEKRRRKSLAQDSNKRLKADWLNGVRELLGQLGLSSDQS